MLQGLDLFTADNLPSKAFTPTVGRHNQPPQTLNSHQLSKSSKGYTHLPQISRYPTHLLLQLHLSTLVVAKATGTTQSTPTETNRNL